MTQAEPVVGRPRETALSVVVPEAEATTLDFRRRYLERTVARRIPAHVTILYPFVDADTAPEPHLTIGEGPDVDALRTEADRVVAPALPVPCRAGSVTLLEEQADGTWSERAAFPLGRR